MYTFHTGMKVGLIRILVDRTDNQILQCDAPYRGQPTNFFYKLANQDTRIWLTVVPPCKVQQASDATTNH